MQHRPVDASGVRDAAESACIALKDSEDCHWDIFDREAGVIEAGLGQETDSPYFNVYEHVPE